jgi:Trypsin
VPLSSYTVFLGSNIRTGSDSHRVIRDVKRVANNENYERYYWGYDISVLTLSDSVTFNDYIIPVCLQTPSMVLPVSSICYSTGWGLTDYNQSKKI